MKSAGEHGTLFQLRNLINRKNVVVNPKSNFNLCDDFIQTIISSYILATALNILGMKALEDTPSTDIISSPESYWMHSAEERKSKLSEISKKICKIIEFSFHGKPAKSSGDHVYDYSSPFLSIGCFYLEFKDAIREGEGRRVLRYWRYLLPVFHFAGCKNYCMEALHLLCQYSFLLPPRQAEQLIWSRFVNTQGVVGRNIPLDLHLEHLNRLCKTTIAHLGVNKTEDAIVRCSKALGTVHSVLDMFNKKQ